LLWLGSNCAAALSASPTLALTEAPTVVGVGVVVAGEAEAAVDAVAEGRWDEGLVEGVSHRASQLPRGAALLARRG